MDIDADQLGIPDTDYDARVTMPSSEFSRICRDLSQLGESVRIEVSKDGVRFASDGEAANGSVLLKQTEAARRKYKDYGKEKKAKEEEGDDDAEEGSSKGKKGVKVKREDGEDAEMAEGDEDVEEDDGGEFKAGEGEGDEDGEEERDGEDSDEESENRKKRKKAGKVRVASTLYYLNIPEMTDTSTQVNGAKPAKRSKKSSGDDESDASGGVSIEMNQHVQLTFSLKYLVNFAKSASLSDTVQLMMSNDVPLLVRSPSLGLILSCRVLSTPR
jgi:proliferating cell nuclear antigen